MTRRKQRPTRAGGQGAPAALFRRSRYAFIEINDSSKQAPDYAWLFLQKVDEGLFEIDQFDQIWRLFHGARVRAEHQGLYGPMVSFSHQEFGYSAPAKDIIWSWNDGNRRLRTPGLLVTTLDGNPLNTTLSNLCLATRGEAIWLGQARKRALALDIKISMEDLFRSGRKRR